MALKKIISGGQTGADEAGLRAGKHLGLETGGWMPQGYRTDAGPRPEFAQLYGVQEHPNRDYPSRTWRNVFESDGTIICGNLNSPGCTLTLRYCKKFSKPWLPFDIFDDANSLILYTRSLRRWIQENNIAVLNVAGNRERTNPGIGEFTYRFLVHALGAE